MEQSHLGILIILGTGVLGGMLGGWFFQKIRVPQVVGYIVIGLIVGEAGFGIVKVEHVERLQPFNMFALGVIGFLVGGELKMDTFRKHARQFLAIMFGEGLGAFLLVGLAVTVIVYLLFGDLRIAAAAGAVLGAIASATDPASTVDVLWENRARGILTSSIIAVIALDDALALTLYGIGTGVSQLLTSGSSSILSELAAVGMSLLGACLLGFLFAFVLWFLLTKLHQPEKGLAVAVGLILLLIGICVASEMDVILAAMTLGFVLTNIAPRRSEELFKIMRGFSVSIYALFFVLVGAKIEFGRMPLWVWGIVAAYLVFRTGGKILGSNLGARSTGAVPCVRRYLGLALFTQGGVAIGLSIVAGDHLSDIHLTGGITLGDMVVSVVTATTLCVQLIGPSMVKLSAKLADELGRNIAEEDVLANMKVQDVMDGSILAIGEHESLEDAVRTLSEYDYSLYPVVDKDGLVVGVMSLQRIKEVLTDRDSWSWLLASDFMEPLRDIVTPESSLGGTLQTMEELKVQDLPVVESRDRYALIGLVRHVKARRKITEEVLRRQQGRLDPEAIRSSAA